MKTNFNLFLIVLAILAGVFQTPPALRADPLDSWTSQNSGTTNNLYGVTFANGKFVVVGAPGTVLSSQDGVSWTSHNPGNTNAGAGVIFDGTKYVVSGFDGTILTSPDLASWAQQATGTTNLLREIIDPSGTFFVVGKRGTILTSTNGTNWISRASGTVSDLNSVAYGNGLFVVVGIGGLILTSPDGSIWTSRTSGTSYDLTQVIFVNGIFVASGDGGTILTSPNGIAWTGQNSGTTHELSGVIYANGIFVAVGSAGGNNQTIDTSPDATNWTLRIQASNAQPLYRAAYGNGTFVAVGGNGTILQSGQVGPANQNIFPIATNASIVNLAAFGGAASSGGNYLVGILAGANVCYQLVSTNGTLLGPLVTNGASTKFPKVAFAGNNYLEFWFDNLANDLHAQLISTAGAKVGSALSLGPAESQGAQALLSDGTNFLLVWQDNTSGYYHGQFMTSAGVLSGSAFIISTATKNLGGAYGGGEYLFIWQDGAPLNTYGAFVSTSGSVGSVFQIGETTSLDNNPPAVGFDGANFLAVWNGDTSENISGTPIWNLYGRLVSPSGAFPGSELTLITNQPVFPSLAFDGANYLLSWSYDFDTTDPNKMFVSQFFNRSASPVGAPFSVFSAQGTNTPLVGNVIFDGTKFFVTATIGTVSVSSSGGLEGFPSGAVYGAFITPGVTHIQIYGYVMDNSSNPVAGVDVSASNSLGNVFSSVTDGTGYYSIDVSNGTWDVSVDCGELASLGYACASDQNPIVSDGSVETDFTVQQAVMSANQFTYVTNNNTITITGYTGTNLDVMIPGTITGMSVTGIEDDAFDGDSMTNVTIPNSVTIIGSTAFANCSSLVSVAIPDGVTSIGNAAFGSCDSLASVTIPASVTSIGSGPFSACGSLTVINVDAGNPAYVSVNGVLFNHSQTMLIQYPAGNAAMSYGIPNSVTSIGGEAFVFCLALTNVTVPAGVTSIGSQAFSYCYSLTGINFEGNAPGADPTAFQGNNANGYDNATAYFLLGTTGWSSTFDGLPTAVWGVAPGVPRLTIFQSGTNVILQWPTNAAGFSLESTTNLAPPSVWNTNSSTPVIISEQNTVTNGVSPTQRFFRLSKP